MGPLFSLVILGVIGTVASLATFVVLRFFLPARAAAVLAPLTVASGGAGCFIGMVVQSFLFPKPEPTTEQILDFFWIALASGGVGAGAAIWLFLKVRAARTERRRIEAFD